MRLVARVILGAVGGAVIALVALGHSLNWRRAPRTQADAALVFGCGEVWKRETRCATASAVFHRGMVRWLVVSGGVLVPGTGQTEAAWFHDNLVARGVPAQRILLEARATNTAENVAHALPILKSRGFTRVVLVMSDFEAIRTHLTAKRAWQGQGITIYDYHAPSPGHWSAWTWWLSREGWSLTFYTVSRLFRYRLLLYLCQPGREAQSMIRRNAAGFVHDARTRHGL
jgi:uncharacterized SAM-binding protein YcdF (DUF218 family)